MQPECIHVDTEGNQSARLPIYQVKFQKNIMWQIAMSNLGHDAHVSDFQFIFSNTFFHEFKTCWKMSLQSEIRQSSISYTGLLGRWDK